MLSATAAWSSTCVTDSSELAWFTPSSVVLTWLVSSSSPAAPSCLACRSAVRGTHRQAASVCTAASQVMCRHFK